MSDTLNIVLRLKYYTFKSNNEKFQKRREFYSGKITDDYMRYIDKGIAENDYLEYAGNDEKSSGIFNQNGILSKAQKAELRNQLRQTQSVIWDMIISFKEDYGKEKLSDYKAAQSLLNAQLNKFFKKAGLNPDNIIWYAGMHENTENKHIHLSFFEKMPLYIRQKDKGKHYHLGKLNQLGLDSFKLSIEQYFSENAAQLKINRKNTLAAYDAAMLFSKNNNSLDKEIKNKISKIISMLPTGSRLGYDSDNMILVRPYIDNLTAYLLKNDKRVNENFTAFSKVLQEYDKQILEICGRQKIKNPEQYLQSDKIIKDLYRRLGNKTVKLTLDIKQQQRRDCKAVKSFAARKRMERKSLILSLEESLKLYAIYETECQKAFEEYLYRLEKARVDAEIYEAEME